VLGYVLKDAGAEQLIRAIRAAAAGRRYLSPPLSEQAVQEFLAKSQSSAQRFEDLTHREQEVLLMSAQGLSANGVAQRLGISCRTVEVHRARAMVKLGLRDRFELIRWAVRRGIITPGPP
jgi:DNA-binding NarL/FixJ family response regulator